MRALKIKPLLVVSEIHANHLHKKGQQNKTALQSRACSKTFHTKLHGNFINERTKQCSQRDIFALVFSRLRRDHQLTDSDLPFFSLNYSVENCLCNIDNASKV